MRLRTSYSLPSAILLAVFLAAICGCSRDQEARSQYMLQIKGSDTMVNLIQAWAEVFMEQNAETFVAVTGGGSGTGIASLIGGTCDLAATSRQIKPKEIQMAEKHGAHPNEFTVALDGIAVVVHPDNPVQRLTMDQLGMIFTGEIANWSKLGGRDAEIILLSREVNSGTHVYFKEHVLGQKDGKSREFSPKALLLPSSQALADEVAANPAAIGYYGMGYLNDSNAAVSVAKAEGEPFIAPEETAVRDGSYPISRPLLLYTRQEPDGLAKQFIDFVFSEEGQRIVKESDFIPL